MSVFVNRNINGKWNKVEVSDDEIMVVEKALVKKNAEIAAKTIQYLPGLIQKNLPEGHRVDSATIQTLIPIFVDRMTTPLHYAIENFVDQKLHNASVNSL